MIEIDLDSIREKAIGCLTTSLDEVAKQSLTHATSFGVALQGRFAQMSIALNEDDDDSFRCDELASYTMWKGGVEFDEIDCLEDQLYELYEEAEESGKSEEEAEAAIKVRLRLGEQVVEATNIEGFCNALFPFVVAWTKEVFAQRPADSWFPVWIQVEDGFVGLSETWRCDRGPDAPAAKPWDAEPLMVKGIVNPGGGLRVFRIGYRSRKYVGLDHINRDLPSFDGNPLCEKLDLPIEGTNYGQLLRKGDLATYSYRSEMALRRNSPHFKALHDFLEPSCEFLPLRSEGLDWEVANALGAVDVVDQRGSRFRTLGDGTIYGVEHVEFCPVKLAAETVAPVFRLSQYPSEGVFYLENDKSESFVQLCERIGVRGIDFELVWVERTGGLEDLMEEFLEILSGRLERLTGDGNVTTTRYVECIYGYQKELWDLVDKILKSDNPTELIESKRGYLWATLRRASRELRVMEETDSGHMACFGPEV